MACSQTLKMLIIDDETAVVPSLAGPMQLHVLRPKDTSRRYPGVILYSEIFQVTGPIKRSAQMFAAHGFVVIVPEVYHELLPAGTVLKYTPEDTAVGNKCKTDKSLDSYDADAAACVAYLKASPHCTGAVGVAGFCLGGGLAFRAALLPDIRAAAIWYGTDIHKEGMGESTLKRISEIKAELLMMWGRQDPHVPLEGRAKIHAALSAAGTNFQWLELNGQHAFMRDENSYGRYDGELALITYDLAIKMFHRTLIADAATAAPAKEAEGGAIRTN